MDKPARRRPRSLVPADSAPTFNLVLALPGRASSPHTQRAYFRWIDRYLVDVAGLKPAAGMARLHRMSALPVTVLHSSLSAPQMRAWLGVLIGEGHGKQGIGQARAAVTTLASLLAEAGLLDDYTSAAIANVRPPKAEDGQRPGRWLSPEQLRLLMDAGRRIATTEEQAVRNYLLLRILCTMALRREELAAARWSDLSLQNDRVVLRVHGKGRKVAMIDVPPPVFELIKNWRARIAASNRSTAPETALIRRVWKGGRIAAGGLTPDGIWWVVTDAAREAGLGHVAPHDLRRSVAGALHESGVPIEKISRLLRHSNVAVTERYLSRLPQQNEGAVLMSDLLGLEHDWDGSAG